MTSIHAYSDEILVVDDTSASLRLLADILSGAGYRVRLATDGDLALRSAKVHPPALILLDIKMPGMDGYEVCQRLKDDEKTRSIPIIFLSILEDEREKVKAFQVGGVDYINKPIRAEEVLARVNTHLTLRHVQLDLEKRNVELEAARDTLEERVKERSAELEQINRKLERQLEVHLCTLEALRESETEFRRIVDTAAEGIWVLGPDNMTTFVNARMAEMLGYSIEDMIGRPQTDFMFEEDAPDHLSKMENRRQGLSEHYERRFRRKDGQTAWTLASATPVFDADRCYRGSFAMFTDITERKQGEQRLHEKERHSQSLLRLSRRLELAQTFMEVVDAARDEVREIIGYQSLWVFLFSEDKKHAYALLAGGAMSEAVMSETGAATLTIEGDRMLEEIAEAKGIVVVEDARTDPRTDKAMVARMENRTIVNVPIIFMDRHLGSVGTGTFGDEGVHPPTKSQEEYLSALASHMAVTLDRLHLLTERKRGEQERLAHLRFFENMDKVNRAIQGTRDLDSMMNNLLGEVLSIFDCDRAWLFHPCDPDAPAFRVPMEVTKPEYPGAKILNVEIPIPPEMAQNLREALESAGPVTYTAGTERPVNNVSAEVFGVKSQMMVAVYPKSGKPWAFGIHQCSHPRVWTQEEQRFLQEISWRLADSLTSLLAYRDLQVSEKRLAEAQHIAQIGNWELDIASNVLTWSNEIYRMFEIDPGKFGASYEAFLDAIHPDDREAVNLAYNNSLSTRTPYKIDHRLRFADGRIEYVHEQCETYYDAEGNPIRSVGTVQNVTERKLAENALHRLNRELQAISSCNQILMRAVDEQALLDEVCRIFCDEAGYRFAWVGFAENDEAKTIRPVAWAGVEDGYLAEARLTWADTERGRGPSGTAIRSGKCAGVQDFAVDPQVSLWREKALARGYRSSVALPLQDENANTFGSLQIYSTESNVFTPPEMRLLEELAADLAFGIATLRTRAERERVEKALQEERKLFIGGPNVAFLWRAVEGWPVEYVSPNVVEQFGYTQEDFTSGKVSYARIVHPDDLERIAEEGKAYGESGVPCFDQEYRIACADGGYRWVYDFTVVRRDSNGVVTHFRGYISDITARKRAEDIRQARLFLLEYADSHTVDELLTATLDRIEALTGSSIGFYHFIEADQETVFLQNWSTNTLLNMCKAEGRGSHYNMAQAGVWVECVQARRPIIHNDYASLPNRKGLPEGHASVSREVVVPVFRAGLITAIVGVGNKALNYDESDVDIVWQLADLSWDIVERKRKEEEIRRTAEEWRTTFDSITDMVSVQDADFTLVRVNEAYSKAVGMTREALIGKKCYEIVHGTECPVAKCPHEKTLRTGEAFVEEIFEPRLGVYLEASTSPIVAPTGEVMGSIHIAKDITERKRAEDAVRRSEEEKTTLNAIANVFLTIPDEEMYEEVLAIVLRIFNCPLGLFGYIGRNGDLIIPSLSRDVWGECQVPGKCSVFPADSWGDSLWGKVIREKTSHSSNGPFHTPTGHILMECFLSVPIVFGQETIGLISVANKRGGFTENDKGFLERIAAYVSPILNARLQRDQEERNRMEAQEEVRHLNAELEERVRDRTAQLEIANKELEAFSYSVSHDLRAPLRHVTGFVNLLNKRASDDLDEKSRHYLTVISDSALQMGKLIDDVLSFSRMGRAELVKTRVSLQDLLTEVLQMVAHELEGRNIVWQVDRLPDVYGSREMLRMVMANLISNAVKFTSSKPEAIIELRHMPDAAEDIIFVRDNGAGFDMRYADKLFGLFQRLHSTDEFEGTGLGLANVRRIVRRHGGRTWAEGVVGEGATFFFSLPK
ncbi:MAG: GAF domain-containing protein, partial [FCB group bacterium]|nr:GAF domain-containing protein [FCB group bacterium]